MLKFGRFVALAAWFVSFGGAGEDQQTGHLRFVRTLCLSGIRTQADIMDLCPLPNGRDLIATTMDGGIRVFEIRSGTALKQWQHEMFAWYSCPLPDGKRVILVGLEGEFAVLDLDSGHFSRPLDDARVRYLCPHPDGRHIFMAFDKTGQVDLLRIGDWRVVRSFEVFPEGKGTFGPIMCDPKGKWLAVRTGDALKLIDTKTGRKRWEIGQKRASGHGTLFAGDGTLLTTVDGDGQVCARAPATGLQVWKTDVPRQSYFGILRQSPDGAMLAVVAANHGIHLLDPWTGRLVSAVAEAADRRSLEFEFAADGSELLLVNNQIVERWDIRGKRRVHPAPEEAGHCGAVRCMAFLAGSRCLMSADERQVLAWNVDQPAPGKARRISFDEGCYTLAGSPTDDRLVGLSAGACLSQPNRIVLELKGRTWWSQVYLSESPAEHIVFSGNGGAMAVIGGDLALFEAAGRKMTRRVQPNDNEFTGGFGDFAPGGAMLAWGWPTRFYCLEANRCAGRITWPIPGKGTAVARRGAPGPEMRCCRFLPNGDLLTGWSDGRIRLLTPKPRRAGGAR